jgi:hypothetical protein
VGSVVEETLLEQDFTTEQFDFTASPFHWCPIRFKYHPGLLHEPMPNWALSIATWMAKALLGNDQIHRLKRTQQQKYECCSLLDNKQRNQ